MELHRFFQQLPALPRVKGNKTREAEQHTELHLKLVAHELRGAPHRRVRVSATLCLRHGDHTADTTDADRTRAGAHSCLEHTGVADDAAVLFDYEVPVNHWPRLAAGRAAERLVVVLAAVQIALYVGIAIRTLGYPFPLEWMEGGSIDVIDRVRSGLPIYTRPTASYVPYIYAPMFFLVATRWLENSGAISPPSSCRICCISR